MSNSKIYDEYDALVREHTDLRTALAAAKAERDALREALAAIQAIAVDYCHNDISVQIKYDTNAALNRILEITEGGAS